MIVVRRADWFVICPCTLVLLAVLGACGNADESVRRSKAEEDTSMEQMEIPPFQIRLYLSDAASKLLSESGETVSVVAYFDGDGIPLPCTKTAPFRDVYLGMEVRELRGSGVATFSGISFPQRDWNRLKSPNVHITLNVHTSRRIFKYNLIRGGTHFLRLDNVRGTEVPVYCHLSSEKRGPR